MSSFEFQYPWAFALLALFLLCAKLCKQRSFAIFFPHISTLMAGSALKRSLSVWLKYITIVSAVTALASPVLTQNYLHSKKNGRDIVLVLDSSDSMRQRGFDPSNPFKSKFDAVKEVVKEFISKRKDDRIGIITFADIAFVASPLTFEKEFLQKIADMQSLHMAGSRTAIQDAIVQAYRLLDKSKAKSKIIILLTDGADNASRVSVGEALDLVKSRNIKLYTIGIGSPRDYNGAYLDMFAKAGNGEAFGARDKQVLKKVYERIDRLEKSKIQSKKITKHKYLFVYVLFLALLSLLAYIYIQSTA